MALFFNKILDFIFPKQCLGCGAKDEIICQKCLKSIPLPENNNQIIMAAAIYKDPIIQKAIRALKYRKSKIVAETLADLIINRLKDKLTADLIIPIPLSKSRMKKRGFNQAELIANFISDKTKIPLITDVLYRNKNTPPQAEIKDRNQRIKNMENAYGIKNIDIIKNKTIIVLDDVSTTGATIIEAIKILEHSGAKKAFGITVAR